MIEKVEGATVKIVTLLCKRKLNRIVQRFTKEVTIPVVVTIVCCPFQKLSNIQERIKKWKLRISKLMEMFFGL